jgi:hypothetical protein
MNCSVDFVFLLLSSDSTAQERIITIDSQGTRGIDLRSVSNHDILKESLIRFLHLIVYLFSLFSTLMMMQEAIQARDKVDRMDRELQVGLK